MDTTFRTLCLLFSLSAVAVELAGCGRVASEQVDDTTSTTSASISVPQRDQGELLSPTPAGSSAPSEGEAVACIGTSTRSPIVAPLLLTTHRSHAKPKPSLEDAIAQRVAADQEPSDQNVAPAPLDSPPAPAPSAAPAVQAVQAASARVTYDDSHLPQAYRLRRLQILIDGVVAYDAPVVGTVLTTPGDHAVEVIAIYRVNDPVFTYVGDHEVELRSTEVIESTATPVVFVATAIPKGNATTPIGQRTGIGWRSFAAREPSARP